MKAAAETFARNPKLDVVETIGTLGTGDPVTIVADGDTVYATGTSLYVADDHVAHTMTDTPVGAPGRTEIYQFDISGAGKPVYVASGGVDGGLLNQYSLSDHDGHLRVATTVADQSTRTASESAITVLTRKGDELTQVGRVAGLGVGERIYAVRFMGDTGYVVTFRQTDPLYTVDLSNPAAPKVTGELKITGYSAYLHPAGDGLDRRDSLAGRLTRTLIVWVGGVWLLCVLGVVWYVDREINHNFDNELVEVSHRMFDMAVQELDKLQHDGGTIGHDPLIAPLVLAAFLQHCIRTAERAP